MRPKTRRQVRLLGGFGLYFVCLWLLWNTPLVYPLQVFVVFLHEISHGAAALATGGSIQRITLNPRLGGACYCPGGNAFLTLSAGYLGSLIWGAAIFEVGRKAGRRAPAITGAIGVAVLVLTLLFVRSAFGILFGLLFGAFLLVLARRLSIQTNRTALLVIGLTSCLYAVLDIKSDVLDRSHLPSDAYMLSQLTGVPTVIWGFVWISVAIGVSGWLLRRAYRDA
ncbi:MAG: M50 family metallopeptidase [Gemmatimonadota bacterium]